MDDALHPFLEDDPELREQWRALHIIIFNQYRERDGRCHCMYRNFLGLRCDATDGDHTWRIWWVRFPFKVNGRRRHLPIPYIHRIHLELDHIIPWSWDHTLAYEQSNFQILCCCHNAKKGNRNDVDYRPGHYSWTRVWVWNPAWKAISRRRGWHDPGAARREKIPH